MKVILKMDSIMTKVCLSGLMETFMMENGEKEDSKGQACLKGMMDLL